MKKLSLCMIVKNEEKYLERCLDSIKDIVDEIIIIDTGSTDKTKDLAQQYTSHVFDYTWNNNFADARNYSISKATGDWILILDADEELIEGTCEDFKTLMDITLSQPLGYQISIENLKDDSTIVLSYMIRLFPNSKSLKFNGSVHEWLENEKDDLKTIRTQQLKIKHYGYQNISKEKLARNIKILKEMKSSTHSNFYLAATYASSKDYAKATKYIKRWEEEALGSKKSDLSLGYTIYLECMLFLGRSEEATKHIAPHIMKCWDNPEFCINLALCYEKIEEYEKAVKIAERVKNSSTFNVSIIDTSKTEWVVNIILGNCYLKLAEYDKVIESWDKAYCHTPTVEVLQNLLDFSYQLHDMEKIEKYVVKMRETYPEHKNENNELIYANLLFNKNELEESINIFLTLSDGEEYIERLVSGLVSMKRFSDIEKIQQIVENSKNLEHVS